TGDDSLDDLVSLVTNGTSIPERVVDNTEDIVRRAKELLESPDKKSFGRENDLVIDSGFDRSVMSDRVAPLSAGAVVQASLQQLQQDLQLLSNHLTGQHSSTVQSKNRTPLDVDSFIDEKWLTFSSG
uniref:Uncharacterized protein n=1 Tax=Plectus sambesii TaxID=2011161 RepID=A0A914VFT8_9BILA